MLKKFVALFVVFAMLMPLSSVVAADEPSAQPTIEEILSEYHQKSFEARQAQETGTASTYSRSASGSGKSLEEETVEQLTDAGYEAYLVTAENRLSIEAQMNTAFSDSMFSSGSSYIVVIHGEEPTTQNSARGTDLILPPHVKDDPIDAGDTFTYTEDGVTYTMRYVTVASVDNISVLHDSQSLMFSSIANLENLYASFGDAVLTVLPELLDFVPIVGDACTIISLIQAGYALENPELFTVLPPDALVFRSGTSWTRNYIQIQNKDTGWWYTSQCSSWAITLSYFDGPIVPNLETGAPEEFRSEALEVTTYSSIYHDTSARCALAVRNFKAGLPIAEGGLDIYVYFTAPNGVMNFGITDGPIITHQESNVSLMPYIQEE